MKNIFIYIISFVLFSSSCSSQEKEKLSAEYNNRGNTLVREAQDQEDKNIEKQILEKAILFYDSSIIVLPTFGNYENKIRTQCKLKQYDKALTSVEDLEKIAVTAETSTMKGFISDKMGKTADADKFYNRAIELYAQRINSSKDPVGDKCNSAFLIALTRGKNEGIKEIKKIIKENPNNPNPKDLEVVFEEFDRNTYISQLWE